MFDATVQPGWLDWLSVLLAVIGFGIAIKQVTDARDAANESAKQSKEAVVALAGAQKQLSQRSLMAVNAQLATVVDDLGYALDRNNAEIARRAILRFGSIAKEASGLLLLLDGDYSELITRVDKAVVKATRDKGKLFSMPPVTVIASLQSVVTEIELLNQEIAGLTSVIRHRIEGIDNA